VTGKQVMKSNLLNAVTEDTRLSDLTVGQFKALMDDIMQEFLWQIEERLPEEMSLNPEIEAYLKTPLEEKAPFYSGDTLKRELGLDE
jgi:tryptophanyl-tRNA synthetase